jgi:hypothetical protein
MQLSLVPLLLNLHSGQIFGPIHPLLVFLTLTGSGTFSSGVLSVLSVDMKG